MIEWTETKGYGNYKSWYHNTGYELDKGECAVLNIDELADGKYRWSVDISSNFGDIDGIADSFEEAERKAIDEFESLKIEVDGSA